MVEALGTEAPAAKPAPGPLDGVIHLVIERVALFAGDAVRDSLTRLSGSSPGPAAEHKPRSGGSNAAALLFAIAVAAGVAAVLAARSERAP